MFNENTTYEARPRCGEIWMCNLTVKEGSIQSGYRPVFILSNDKNNTYSTTLNIIPITSKMNKAKLPTHVEIDASRYQLVKDSVILLEQVRTIDKKRLKEKMGHLDDGTMAHVNSAIQVRFGLSESGE